MKKSLEISYDITVPESSCTADSEDVSAKEYLDNLMQELKRSFTESNSHAHKLQILTLSPYTIKETVTFFETTEYMMKKRHSLKREHGILPNIPLITEHRHMCPGKKDCMRVRDCDGMTSMVQKRLFLGKLKEISELYKADHEKNPGIGFSTFAK